MNRLISFAIAALLPLQAAALSCVRPDIATTYAAAAESEDSYVILLGRFDVAPNALPQTDLSDPDPETTTAPSTFRGQQLQADGSFEGRLNLPVTLMRRCAGPWCGNMDQDRKTLAFLRQTEDGLSLDLDPCGMWQFPDPTDETLDRLAACVTSGPCEPAEF